MNEQQIREAWQHLQAVRRAGVDAIFTGTHEHRQELVAQQKAAVKALESLGVVFA